MACGSNHDIIGRFHSNAVHIIAYNTGRRKFEVTMMRIQNNATNWDLIYNMQKINFKLNADRLEHAPG